VHERYRQTDGRTTTYSERERDAPDTPSPRRSPDQLTLGYTVNTQRSKA